MTRELRVAALIKQIPRFEEMRLGDDGRLIRNTASLEVNPYCRRAVSKAIELAKNSGGKSVVLTLGPPQAEDALKEMLAAGADEAILITDPQFAGSDTLATARAIAAALRIIGPFDIILSGLNSVDADTGQVGPEVAEMMDLPFVAGVRTLEILENELLLRCERDDGWRAVTVDFPAVLSVAERLCSPAKANLEARQAIPDERIQRLDAALLGTGPWGTVGSPTRVGKTRILSSNRDRLQLSGTAEEMSSKLLTLLDERGLFEGRRSITTGQVRSSRGDSDEHPVAVVIEPGRTQLARELLGEAAELAANKRVKVVALAFENSDPNELASWGADTIVISTPNGLEESAASVVADWSLNSMPSCLLGPSTTWGREVMGRVAARLDAGLTGDVVEIEQIDNAMICWKPAFGGQLVAAVTSTSPIQMATIRSGVLPILEPRNADVDFTVKSVSLPMTKRVRVINGGRNNDGSALMGAGRVVGLGLGVDPEDYPKIDALCDCLGAERASTRKVTDRGWMSRGTQIGITGLSIAPELYIAIGIHGSFNHTVGIRRAGTIVAINSDPSAPIFDQADLGIVGDWRKIVPYMIDGLKQLGCKETNVILPG